MTDMLATLRGACERHRGAASDEAGRRISPTMSIARHHAEWLSLVEVSGPFLSLPVLLRVFPQGLDAHDADHARSLRMAFAEWQDNQTGPRPTAAIHDAWIRFVLTETLGMDEKVLVEGQAVPQSLQVVGPRAQRSAPAGPDRQESEGRLGRGQAPAADPDLSQRPGFAEAGTRTAVEGVAREPDGRPACTARASAPGS